MLKLIVVFLAIVLTNNVQGKSSFITSSNFEAEVIANISIPRGLLVDEAGDILVLTRGKSSIFGLYKNHPTVDHDAYTTSLIVNGTGLGLNHGIAYNKQFLYASSGSTVYRWPYTPGQRRLVQDPFEIVISNISVPDENKINTRTIIFDSVDLLYVTINSDIRLDNDSRRCRIRRFNISKLPDNGEGIEFEDGEIFADGLRNEVGLTFDEEGTLWGVENAGGADYLIRDDLGGNIHDGNPAEEMNKFDKMPGTHYGYPYCFGSHNLSGYPIGTPFAWPTAIGDGIHNDEWCRNTSNNERAIFFMPAHQAPLGIEFYSDPNNNCGRNGAFPCSAKGNAIVTFHGSINITIPVGYKVVMYTINNDTKLPNGELVDIIVDENNENFNNVSRTFRPVNAVFDKEGYLIVSADTSNEIIKISYKQDPPFTGGSNRTFPSLNKIYFMIVSFIVLRNV